MRVAWTSMRGQEACAHAAWLVGAHVMCVRVSQRFARRSGLQRGVARVVGRDRACERVVMCMAR